MSMTFSVLLLLDIISLVSALPAGGSGGTRGGSGSGSSSGGSSGSSGGSSSGGSSSGGSSSSGSGGTKNGSGWTSSRNNGTRSTGPLSKGAKIALAVIGGIFAFIVLVILIKILIDKYKERKHKHSPVSEKALSSKNSSPRSSIEGQEATLSHNPGHTQAAVHPVSNPTTSAELTSAVMAGGGSHAGHGESGAGSGSRGGVGPVPWEARAFSVISKGMSNGSAHS